MLFKLNKCEFFYLPLTPEELMVQIRERSRLTKGKSVLALNIEKVDIGLSRW